MSEKRLLILGAGRGQVGLYKAAKALGITTVAGTLPGDRLPCVPLADEVCHMDIANPEDVLEKAKGLNLNGVATCCLDTGLTSLGYTCDQLGLTGLSKSAAVMCNDKSKMKAAFIEHGVSTAKYFEISTEAELEEAMVKIQLPVIIKATDLQGSRGIYIAHTKEEAFTGFREALSLTKRSYCIVEEFIEGWEFGAQAYVYNGEILFVMPHGDETVVTKTAVPVGHYVPLEVDDDVKAMITDVVTKAIRALGLNNCAVNVDLILRDNVPYIIELTGRVGANCLPELVEINWGLEYYKMIALMAVGEDPRVLWNQRSATETAGLARMIISHDLAGEVTELGMADYDPANVLEVTFFCGVGNEVRIFENSNDCIGQIIVKGSTLADCEREMDELMKKVILKVK